MIISGYRTTTLIYESANSIIYQGCREEDDLPVILKMLKEDYPSPEELARYEQEYEITRILKNTPGVIAAYDLLSYQNRLVIILEDFGGESLNKERFKASGMEKSLEIFIRITKTLGAIHAADIIHKDINPSNIALNPKTEQLRIIDFGIAEIKDTPTSHSSLPTSHLEGTLAYISPEQTGRMNRSADHRTDFYSLGVTFYELLTGKLPFESSDAMELIHSHIAKQPVPSHEVRPQVPNPLSDIIMKLLAKSPEDRYQTARGIWQDLEICRDALRQHGQIAAFPLGAQDHAGRFQIPQKLYGRKQEIETLAESFASVCQGQGEIMMITGYSGVGKSSLVTAFCDAMNRRQKTGKHPCFIAGKFDQFQRNVPYSAVVSAFSDLVRQILAQDETQLRFWREKLLSVLGPNGQVITDVIPEIERITGPQPRVAPLTPAEARNRFNLTFQNFIRVFSLPERPLVIFLDDLQWGDTASLQLIQQLIIPRESEALSNSHAGNHLLFIGVYRDNEVDATHPLMVTLDEIQKLGVPVGQISLAPLKLPHVTQFVSEALACPLEKAGPLAELLLEKTDGNPFFMGEFLKSLHDENLLAFSFQHDTWEWNSEQIRAREISDNVGSLMAGKIQKLGPDTREILKLAACIGNQFDVKPLSIVCEKSQEATLKALEKAIREGLIADPNSPSDFGVSSVEQGDMGRFRFSHDQIQQAAYALLSDSERQAIHWQVGNLLLENIPPDLQEQRIFDIVNHLNLGIRLIRELSERERLIRMNLTAGRRAKASAAYGPAIIYLQQGIDLLGKTPWENQYELALPLHVDLGETAYLSTDFALMEQMTALVFDNAKNLLDKEKAYEVKIRACLAQNRIMDAIELSLKILKLLGMPLPRDPGMFRVATELIRTSMALAGKKIESLIELPEMSDPHKVSIIRILSIIGHAAYIAIPNLMPIMALKVITLSLKYGNASFSAYSYGAYGVILSSFLGKIDKGYQFGRFSLMFIGRAGNKEFESRTICMHNCFIRHWKEHARQSLKPLTDAWQIGLENGDLEYAGISIFVYLGYSFWVGKELGEVDLDLRKYIPALRQIRQETPLHWCEMLCQAVTNLKTETEIPYHLRGKIYDEETMLPIHLEVNERVSICYLHFLKLFLAYLSEDYEEAIQNSEMVRKYLEAQIGTMTPAIFHCFDSLAQLAVYHSKTDPFDRKRILRRVARNQKKIRRWANHAPMNYLNKWYLAEGERARVLGNDLRAMDYYKLAVQFARENQYLQEEALANELLAKFHLGRDEQKVARLHMKEAHYCYRRWGATSKLRQLEDRYPELLAGTSSRAFDVSDGISQTIAMTTRRHDAQALDLGTVMKSANAMSGEIVLESLLRKMMRVVLENAGAQKGFLILEKEEALVIEAEGAVDTEDITVLQSLPVASALPASVLNYVSHSHECVVLSDAAHEGQFTNDPYVLEHLPKSLLCLPLLNQGKLTGILYLENNLTTDAFTPNHLEILSLLSSQMAISIENAGLYQNVQDAARQLEEYNRTLEQKVDERTRELDQKNIRLNETLGEVEEAHRNITDSIEYAKRIQSSILPSPDVMKACLPQNFVIWRPRDMVGGDFFYADASEQGVLVSVVDCTGHGVPGAFMTMIASSGLRRITGTEGCHDPAEILKRLNFIVKTSLQQDTEHALSDDGLDAAICLIQSDRLIFAGAKLPLICVHKDELRVIKGDRQSIGYKKSDLNFDFSNHMLDIEPGMAFYMASDGFEDQLGGKKHFPFGKKRLRNLLRDNAKQPFEIQKTLLLEAFDSYKGGNTRQDDVTIVGFSL